ncbi:unnamed protein product, partial [marine sediment metagenome]
MYCIYNDQELSSRMAAGVVMKYAIEQGFIRTVDFVPWNYTKSLPVLEKGRRVIMIGVTFLVGEMYGIKDISNGEFVWISHHTGDVLRLLANKGPAYCKPVIPEVTTFKLDGKKMYTVHSESVAELTFEYYYPTLEVPKFIKWIGWYDTGKYEHEDNANEIR